jgi:BioD-like phosphotransacetylase family protein
MLCAHDAVTTEFIGEYVGKSSFPVLKSKDTTAETMRKIAGFTAKLQPSDPVTVNALIAQVEPHIKIDAMLSEVDKHYTA